MQQDSTACPLLGRGVYRAAYFVDGRPVLHAITRRGDCIKRVVLRDDVDESRAIEWMERLLDEKDPEPVLRLVRAEPSGKYMSPGALLGLLRRR